MIVADIDVWRVATMISSRATNHEQAGGRWPVKILNHLLALGVAILVSAGAAQAQRTLKVAYTPFNVPIVLEQARTWSGETQKRWCWP